MWSIRFLPILLSIITTEQNFLSSFENVESVIENVLGVNYNTIDYDTTSKETYDFIVVGSGPAGSVLANRLSENPNWNVLLLELGTEATVLSDIPANVAMVQFTDYNWGYFMEKQDNFCLGLIDQRMHWPRGKVLGGTSVINYMIHVRGNRDDYDKWEALGNPGWSYKDVLPYFLKMEDSSVRVNDPGYHRTGGYLSIQDIPYRTESAHAFVRSAKERGYKYVDYNGESQMGVSYIQGTLRKGTRCSAEKAYLRPVKARRNLKISIKSRALQVLIDPTTKVAYGVQYKKNGQYRIARASKEVILSAGAFNSPQLLMLSGVGPKKHLEELGIPVLHDLPVGEILYDHITFLGLVFTVNKPITLTQSFIEQPQNILQFALEGTGPVTTLGGVEAIAYLKTNVSQHAGDYPDMELLFIGSGLHADNGGPSRLQFRVSDEVYDKLWRPLENSYAWTVFPMMLHPKSYGHLKLKSKNPFHWPKFYGNYMTDPDNIDMKTMIAAVREVQNIAQSPSFQKYGCKQVRVPVPGCESHEFDSDAYWDCAIRHITVTLHHQVATCKMGPPSDPEAIVDHRLRVYGIKNLRVADTSIIPIPLAAHTNTPSYMVGERAADLIKDDWK